MSESPWIPWLYQYAVGGAVFAASLWVLARAGALDLRDREDRRTLAALAAGFLGFLALHAAWIRAAAGS